MHVLAISQVWAAVKQHEKIAVRRAHRRRVSREPSLLAVDCNVLDDSPAPRDHVFRRSSKKPTENMLNALRRYGIPDAEEYDYFAAGKLIGLLVSRSKRGLCTWKMARQLKARGLDQDMKMEPAKKLMAQWFGKGK